MLRTANLHLYLLHKYFKIVLRWIPGHFGIPGNEAASRADKSTTSPDELFVPLLDMTRGLKLTTLRFWQNTWDTEIDDKLRNPAFYSRFHPLLPEPKIQCSTYKISYRAHVSRSWTPVTCRSSTNLLSVCHILIECPAFCNLRLKYFGTADLPHANLFLYLANIGFMNFI